MSEITGVTSVDVDIKAVRAIAARTTRHAVPQPFYSKEVQDAAFAFIAVLQEAAKEVGKAAPKARKRIDLDKLDEHVVDLDDETAARLIAALQASGRI